jgi:hypothetical protein
MSLVKIICHVQPMISPNIVCVMPVHVPRHINYHINCLQVLHLLLCNLYFLMSRVMLLNLSVARDTMFHPLTIIVSLPRYTYFVISLRFSSIFLNFKPLLSVCLIAKLSLFNPIGVASMSTLIPSFTRLASLIRFHAPIPINKTGLLNASTITLLRWDSLCLPNLPCLLNIGMRYFLPPYIL